MALQCPQILTQGLRGPPQSHWPPSSPAFLGYHQATTRTRTFFLENSLLAHTPCLCTCNFLTLANSYASFKVQTLLPLGSLPFSSPLCKISGIPPHTPPALLHASVSQTLSL